jgi:hypothetical protein
MNLKTTSGLILAAISCAFAAAMLLLPATAAATTKPENPKPPAAAPAPAPAAQAAAQAQAAAAATAAAQASSTSSGAATAGNTLGDIAPSQLVGGQAVSSHAWSLFAQPPAFTPPMAPIAGCAPVITQEATSGWLILGGLSTATGKTDPTDCTLIALRNAKVEQCQYASAKQIEDLLTAKLLPGFKPGPADGFTDLEPRACATLKAPPKPEAEIRYISAFAPPTPPAACEKAPAPKPGKATGGKAKTAIAAAPSRACTP